MNLPDFTRIIWTSQQAREVWEPRIRAIGADFKEVEYLSVKEGIRSACILTISPEELPELYRRVHKDHLDIYVDTVLGRSNSYSSTPIPVTNGVVDLRVVIFSCPRCDIEYAFTKDKTAIGPLLGYPECCQNFFHEEWELKSSIDPTGAMKHGFGGELLKVLPENNILLRWFGVRLVPHLPCSHHCDGTFVFARELSRLWKPETLAWAKEILSWPVEWSALHGIAEIKTPIAKISTRTDYSSEKRVIRIEGSSYPTEGASGIRFPYKRVQPVNASEDLWTLNGFSSKAAMARSHNAILELVHDCKGINHVYDLGCGNGTLLSRIHEVLPDTYLYGFDLNSKALMQGRRHHPQVNFYCKDLFEVFHRPDLAADLTLLMPGRLTEVNQERAQKFVEKLQSKYVLLYGYSDWITRVNQLRLQYFNGWEVMSTCSTSDTEVWLIRRK